jgi:hypothetical protein
MNRTETSKYLVRCEYKRGNDEWFYDTIEGAKRSFQYLTEINRGRGLRRADMVELANHVTTFNGSILATWQKA